MIAKELGKAVLGVILAAGVAWCNEGCERYPGEPYTSQSDIDRDYRSEMRECIRQGQTNQDVEDCQEKVRWKYGVCEVPSNGDPMVPSYAPCRRSD